MTETGTESGRRGASRRERLASVASSRTVVEGLGLLGVGVGLWTVAGVPGAAGAAVVALLLYALSGVYAFGAGQFVLAAAVPPRLTPDLVLVELGLVLVLVGETATRRGLWQTALGAAVLTLVAVTVGVGVGVERVVEARPTDVALLAGGGFALLSGALWLFARSGRVHVAALTDRHGIDGER